MPLIISDSELFLKSAPNNFTWRNDQDVCIINILNLLHFNPTLMRRPVIIRRPNNSSLLLIHTNILVADAIDF